MNDQKEFKELSNEWLNLKKLSVKHSTYIKYKNITHLYLDDVFNNKDIDEYTETDYYQLFYNLSHQFHLSNSVLKSIYIVLKGILTYGQSQYHLNIHCPKIPLPASKKEIHVLTKEETCILSSYCRSKTNITTLAVFISMYTGMRLGEICGLKWEDIDLDKGIIHVSRTVQRIENDQNDHFKTSKMIFEPKTQSSKREIVLTDFLIEYLKSYQSLYETDNTFYILSNSLNIPEPRNIQRRFKRLCKRLNINMNFHSLRHSFATNCLSYGIDIKIISETLGHSNISTTMNLYVHPTLDFKREQMNKIPI